MAETKSGVLANKLAATQIKIKALNSKLALLKTELEILKTEAIGYCVSNESSKFGSTKATISYKLVVLPQVTDWTKVHKYVHQHKAFHLFEKRIAAVAWRDELKSRPRCKAIPGIGTFEKPTISITSIAAK